MPCEAHVFGCGCTERCRSHIIELDQAPVDWRPFRIASYVLIALFIALGTIGAVKAVERVNHAYQEDE